MIELRLRTCALLLACCASLTAARHLLHKRSARLCGSELTDMINLICGSSGRKRAMFDYRDVGQVQNGLSSRMDFSLGRSPFGQVSRYRTILDPRSFDAGIASYHRLRRHALTDKDRALTYAGRAFTDTDRALTDTDRAVTDPDRALIDPEHAVTGTDDAVTDTARALPGTDCARVKRQGIVEECCYNPCSLQTLSTYCWA